MQPFKQLNSVKDATGHAGLPLGKAVLRFALSGAIRDDEVRLACTKALEKVSLTGKRNLVVWLRTAAIAILLFFRMPLDREPNEAVNQIRVSESGGRPQLGIQGERRESGQ